MRPRRRRDDAPRPATAPGPEPRGPGPAREAGVVAGLTLLAALVRFWGLGRLGLTHFDEGVYAFAGLWSVAPGGLPADLIPYAPPGYPILVGLAYAVFGVSDVAAILVSILAGVAAVPLAAWIARRTFGPGAGAVAAALAALSMAHVAFSRKALTDAPFLAAWLAAMGLGMRFLERPGAGRAIAMGLAVGLAQNVKYYGWLAGAVVVLAALAEVARNPEARTVRSLRSTFGWGALAIVVAALAYLPWFRFVEANGGYAGLLRHQRGYFLGPGAWWAGLHQQLGQVVALSGGPVWTAVAGAIAIGAGVVASSRSGHDGSSPLGLVVAGAGALALALAPASAWWAGLVVAPALILDPSPARRVLASWWIAQSLLTPLYLPYGRLWLPLHAAGWVVLAGLAATVLKDGDRLRGLPGRRAALAIGAGVAMVVAGWASARPARPFAVAEILGPTDPLRFTLATLPDRLGGRPDGADVLGRRPIAFYLALQGIPTTLLPGGPDAPAPAPQPGRWVILDGALDDATLGPTRRALDADPAFVATRIDPAGPLDPVTRLDVRPASAFASGDAGAPLTVYTPGPTRLEPPR